LVRYCDDFIITFEHEDDARRVMTALGKRLGRFGLTLHPDKTRLLPFRRPPAGQKGSVISHEHEPTWRPVFSPA
jgi:hypothetical protein